MSAYYNENDPFAAQWLRNLIAAGHIMQGGVDERSIADVRSHDLRGFARCHFFAGIGGWDYALQLAGWPTDRPVWTGSCPCQPFSAAGKRRGANDERHLWPEFYRLIRECRPATVFGEQVASKDGRTWLAAVRADLEALGYAVGAADLCAAGVGAPHIRQRLWWVADAECGATERRGHDVAGTASSTQTEAQERERLRANAWSGFSTDGVADGLGAGLAVEREQSARGQCSPVERSGEAGGGMEYAAGDGREQRRAEPGGRSAVGGRAWGDIEWLPCIDGKARPTQPGLFPLAHGVPGRVGKLRAYGNAIVPQVAAEFIEAVMECRP